MHPFVASIKSLNMPVEKIRWRAPQRFNDLIALGRDCMEQDGAEAIVCACASISLLAEEIAPKIGVPVLNSVRLSSRAAEMLVGAGLTHSRITFPKPVKL